MSLHSLGTWQHLSSLSGSIPEHLSRTMEHMEERFLPEPQVPLQRSPQDGLGCPHTVLSLLLP